MFLPLGGLTPLMLASFRSGVLDMTDEVDDDDGSVSMIQDLLMQGAQINMTTERTGMKSHKILILKLHYSTPFMCES